ncbi:MAG: glycosyltransferase family 2 protein [Deltaproteobacteria bacterium]|nr:glycosyltransferase family 2 protein [Deltaproteobacteria bacterium]
MIHDEPAGDAPGAAWPAVSVVVPMRNEAGFARRCLDALRGQDYAGELEIVCVDGLSDDGTRDALAAIAAEDPRVRVVDNPARTTPAAMNVGIRAARHALVLRMDGHALADPDYVRESVAAMRETGADQVGGRWLIEGEGLVAGAIAAAMGSPFAVGTARWRSSDAPGWVDTVPYGLWRRERLLALGGFDERLVRNQDYELAYRLRAAGGRIWYTPAVRSRYYARRDLRALWRQYWQYGVWKARVVKLHPRSLEPRHLVAPLFVAGVVLGLPLALLLGGVVAWLYLGALAVYGALAGFAAARVAARTRWRYVWLLPAIFALLHVAWGAGFWVGLGSRGGLAEEG